MRRAGLAYYSRAAAEYISQYQKGRGVYRPLQGGEWDMMTPGAAYIHGRVSGSLHLRGGSVWGLLDAEKLRATWRAPTHVRQAHEHRDLNLGDEERFGVVFRHTDPPIKKNRWLRAPGTTKVTVFDDLGIPDLKANDQPFAKEYLRILHRGFKQLATLIEGDVFDEQGTNVKHSVTGKPLRSLREYTDDEGSVISQTEIDNDTGSTAWTGTAKKINIAQIEALVQAALKQLQINASQSVTVGAGTAATVQGATTGRISGDTQTLLGPDTQPVDAVIKGTTFNSTVLLPLLQALTAALGSLGGFLTTAGTDPGMIAASSAGAAALVSAGGTCTTLAATLLPPITAAVAGTLSTNVKVSS